MSTDPVKMEVWRIARCLKFLAVEDFIFKVQTSFLESKYNYTAELRVLVESNLPQKGASPWASVGEGGRTSPNHHHIFRVGDSISIVSTHTVE